MVDPTDLLITGYGSTIMAAVADKAPRWLTGLLTLIGGVSFICYLVATWT